MYKIKIIKTEENPNFKEELAQYEEKNNRRGYNNNRMDMEFDPGAPRPEMIKDVLICELTDEQFKKVKKEVLTAFE